MAVGTCGVLVCLLVAGGGVQAAEQEQEQEPVPVVRVQEPVAPETVVSNAPVPVAQSREVRAPEGEGSPVAVVCTGVQCEHPPVGGPGLAAASLPEAQEVRHALHLRRVGKQITLVFRAQPSAAAGAVLYRIEESVDLERWQTTWEGSRADADADASGEISLDVDSSRPAAYYRLKMLTGA